MSCNFTEQPTLHPYVCTVLDTQDADTLILSGTPGDMLNTSDRVARCGTLEGRDCNAKTNKACGPPSLLDVRDVIPRVAVEALLQTLLIQEVANEADGPTHHEQAVQAAALNDLLGLRRNERGSTGLARVQARYWMDVHDHKAECLLESHVCIMRAPKPSTAWAATHNAPRPCQTCRTRG